MENLDERTKRNFEMFERLEKEYEQHLKEKEALLEAARRLGIRLDMEIPWKELTDEQKKELARIKDEGERLLNETAKTKSAPSKSGRWMRI